MFLIYTSQAKDKNKISLIILSMLLDHSYVVLFS